jgi:phosphoribosyl 1,2-cyclic phosphate phosphodiesterase
MPVYAGPETMKDLERVFEFAFKALNPFPGYLKPEPHLVTETFRLGATEITPLPVPHGNSLVNGYLFSRNGEKLVAYLSDCSDVPVEISSRIKGVRALIIDALRRKPHPTHLSVDQALEVATRVKPEHTYFTHICHELPQSEESQLPAGAHMAYDGLQLKF